jgi:hypothetical protein
MRLLIEEGMCPDNLQLENSRRTKEDNLVIQDGIDPTIPAPVASKKFKDVSLLIEEGSSWVKSVAATPNMFKDFRFPRELGIGPEKLVWLTNSINNLLSGEKSGKEPEMPTLCLISRAVKFWLLKILTGNCPSRLFKVSRRTLRDGKSARESGIGPYK